MKYREIEYCEHEIEFCEYGGRFCEHKSPMGYCECEEECCIVNTTNSANQKINTGE